MNPARLNTVRGPRGEIIVTKTYSNWRYSVTMHTDGAIRVNHGDWLSKYSAAMYNDFTRIHEFARMDKSGKLRSIHKANLIFAGETVYHIPTYKHAHPMRMDAIEIIASPLSDEQKKRVIVETLKADYHLQGEHLEILEHAAHILHGLDSGAELLEIAGLIAEGATAVTVLQLASLVLFPIMIGISILNASETDLKIAGMQAIGYTVTAWAFGDPIPPFPSVLRTRNLNTYGRERTLRIEQAWKAASDATVHNLEAQAAKKRVRKKSYQVYWQALGEGDRKKLVRLLMEARAEELRDPVRMSFGGLDPENYPN